MTESLAGHPAGEPTEGTASPVPARRQLPAPIIDAFCAGDVAALGAVYDHYSRAVWSVTVSVLRDRQLAEDAVQEAFMRAWKSAGRFDRNRDLGPWLLTIARRTAVDVHRREFRPTRGDHAPEREIAVELPGIERTWETWEIKLALDQLPEDERVILALAHYQGLTQSQIAERLALPLGTVKSRSSRAHQRLAGLLAHLIEGDDGSREGGPA